MSTAALGRPESVRAERDGTVLVVTIDRPEARNAVDAATSAGLARAFKDFDKADDLSVAVLAGAGGTFCAGADLKAIASGRGANRVTADGDGPMGPTRLRLSKPVIAAVAGHAVAGGLELALWCDMRVADETAVFGVFSRRWGVPLVDGGTVRLPRVVGLGRAMDMVLTGRAVGAEEALAIGLADRVVPAGEALRTAVAIAHELAALPQACLRADRFSVLDQEGLSEPEAMALELRRGSAVLGEAMRQEAARFAAGAGRHGSSA